VLIPTSFQQLPTEKAWLSGELPGSFLASHGDWRPARLWIDIATKIEKVLESCELVPVLRILEQHNIEQNNKKVRERNKSPLLLGPYLFRAIYSVEQKKTAIKGMPVLMRRPAELRAHFHEASTKARALARLLRKGPQPFVALALQSDDTVTLDWVLENAAALFDAVAERNIPRARQHRKPAKNPAIDTQSELRRLAANVLVTAFREKLNHPYYSHVAAIVTILTGIDTDADYVKKIDKRKLRATALRGQNP
jgi:hypothetical protein